KRDWSSDVCSSDLPFEEAFTVEGFECIGGIELESTQKRGETEFVCVGLIVEIENELLWVLRKGGRLVVIVFDKVVNLLFLAMEKHGVFVNVLQEVLKCSCVVSFELDLAIRTVEIQNRIQSVVAQILPSIREFFS